MLLINRQWTRLEQGYELIRQYESSIKNRWAEEVKQIRQRLYEVAHAEWKIRSGKERESYSKARLICVSLLIVGALLSVLSISIFSNIIYLFFSLTIAAAGVFAFPRKSSISSMPTLEETHPVDLDLTKIWWKRLEKGSLSQEAGVHGDEGEAEFAHQLELSIPDNYVGMRGLLVARKLDADILLIGPSGIWVFEVKFISGKISVSGGNWRRDKSYHASGGYLDSKSDALDPLDQQWERERDAIIKTIQKNIKASSWLTKLIYGGLAFVHPKVELMIDSTCRAEYGNALKWIRRIKDAEKIDELNKIEKLLQILDVLTTYGHSLEAGGDSFSATELAQTIYEDTKKKIENLVWVYEQNVTKDQQARIAA